MDLEEQKLRNQPDDGDMFAPTHVFEEHVGHFWGLPHTRPYMRARYALIEAILKIRTHLAVVAALDHVTDCLRLCRGDNMGVRDFVPALLLRLGRDQECYDFVKWYATTGKRDDYDWGDMDEPYLDLKDADILESPQYLCTKYADLSNCVTITLLKIRLLLAVRAGSEGWKELLESSPTFDLIVGDTRRNLTGDFETELAEEVAGLMKYQVKALYEAVDKANVHYWPALINPGRHLDARPPYHSRGTKEGMQMVLKQTYDAWRETPGAIEVIKAILDKKDF